MLKGETVRLFLCEKPSQAKDIARVLGAKRPGGGCYLAPDIIVTWCIGHLIEAVPPEGYGEHYKRWSIETLPIIPDIWRVKIKPSTAAQFKTVKKLMGGASEVVIATDADREGEMIAREVLELCRFRGPVKRLWLSALNDASIAQALATLRPGDATLPLYHAALARSRADWLIGMNLTRLFTLLGQRAGLRGVLSVGRVQTPTLQLIVRRDREIAAFIPVPYWTIEVTLTAEGETFVAHWVAPKEAIDEAGRCLEAPLAQAAANGLRQAGLAQVVSVETERVREPPPLPFDLSTLQQVCSTRLRLDVQETLDLAQALYENHKAITYPRTDCRYLPQSMLAEVPAVLEALIDSDPGIRPLIATLVREQRSRAWDDAKLGAHHGIIPTTEPTALSRMSEPERAVYQLIRAHYLAQFAPHHEYDRTVAQLTCSGESLTAHGKRVREVGWRSLMDAKEAADEADADAPRTQPLPALRPGTSCAVAGVSVKALKTRPPKPYTQGELVQAMKGIGRFVSDPRLKLKLKDTTGIGTEATRAGIIQGLIRRGYLIQKGQALRASESAFLLIDAVPEAIADPGMTAIWEQALERIAAGELSLETFVEKQSAWVAKLVRSHANVPLRLTRSGAP
jgi:DNA topoisomerase-3